MKLNPLFPTVETLAINTDLYELTMAAAYFEGGHHQEHATFELFARKLPKRRSFLIAAGLEQALHFVDNIRFTKQAVDHLRSLDVFKSVRSDFFDYLRQFRFTGDLYALPEGTVFFSGEPILQVTGPIIESQILETCLINSINFQSMVASKAARLSLAGKGRSIVDFGSRRAHSLQAGILAARASFLGGCSGTSNVLAAHEMGIPVHGTMAHSFVQACGDEKKAFELFYQVFQENSILLVDTYDTLAGLEKAVQIGHDIKGVRLDSGNLAELAFQAREFLDRHGYQNTQIVASGDLDEERIHSLAMADTPIDAFGVGTDLVVSTDAPTCDLVYKLVEVIREGRTEPRIKTSQGKSTFPYRKQVFRKVGKGGFAGDVICKWDEEIKIPEGAEPLLQKQVENGRLIARVPDVSEIRAHVQEQLSQLPSSFKLLHSVEEYPVQYSDQLIKVQRELTEMHPHSTTI